MTISSITAVYNRGLIDVSWPEMEINVLLSCTVF